MPSSHLLISSSPTLAHQLHHPFRHLQPHPSPLFRLSTCRRDQINYSHLDDQDGDHINLCLIDSQRLLQVKHPKEHEEQTQDWYEEEDHGDLVDEEDQPASGDKYEEELEDDEDGIENDNKLTEQVMIETFSPTLDASFASSMCMGTAPPTPSPNPQGTSFTHNFQLAPVSTENLIINSIEPHPNAMSSSFSPHRMDISPAPASTSCNISSYLYQPSGSQPDSPDDPFRASSTCTPPHTLSKVSPTTTNTRRKIGLRKTQSRPNLSSDSLCIHPSRNIDEHSSPCTLARSSDYMDIDSPSYAQPHHCNSLSTQMAPDDQPMGTRSFRSRKSRSTSQGSAGKRSRSDEDDESEQSTSRPSSSSSRNDRKLASTSHFSSPSALVRTGPPQANWPFGATTRPHGEPSSSFLPFEPPSSPSEIISPSVKAAAKATVGRKASERSLSGFRFPASKSHIPSVNMPPTTRTQPYGPGNIGPANRNGTTLRRPVLGVVQSSAKLFSRHQSTSTASTGMNRQRDVFGRPAPKSRRAISFAATEGDLNFMLHGDSMVTDPDEDDEESELDVSLGFDCSPAARLSNNASFPPLVSRTWPIYTESPIRPNRSASHNDYRLDLARETSGAGASSSLAPPSFFLAVTSQSPTRPIVTSLASAVESPVGMAFSEKERAGKILPCHKVSNDGLMRISPDTMDRLLEGLYDQSISQKIVIDCRFGYEYDGGHIRTAINIQDKKLVDSMLLQGKIFAGGKDGVPPPTESGKADSSGQKKKVVLVFHCEYSAMRAPTVAKYLREQDRHMNMSHYPALHYPEVYILEGGFARYFAHSPQHCEGTYVGMDDPSYRSDRHADLNQFRTRESAFSSRAKSFTYGENQKLMKNGGHPKKPVLLLDHTRSDSVKSPIIFE